MKLAVTENYQDLKDRILDGVYLPRMHLVEEDLLNKFHVSCATIREALRKLSDDDLVEVIPHKGIRVCKFTISELKNIYVVLKCYTVRTLSESDNYEPVRTL